MGICVLFVSLKHGKKAFRNVNQLSLFESYLFVTGKY